MVRKRWREGKRMIKIKLWCRLFGHDWRIKEVDINNDGYRVVTISPSQWCRNCGVFKEELKKCQVDGLGEQETKI